MRFTWKKCLTGNAGTRYIIKRIYKTASPFSWNFLIFGGFFLSAQSFHDRGRRFRKFRGKGGGHGEVKRSGTGEARQAVPHQALEGSKYHKEGKHG